eukprot:gnl/TRDRNA2_/TRDRNA2_172934_c1_seq1.p1 gnl/TRDRNA2_/TRDRNA2_172934_c1~~gnl/TRDRNA2_/TRDRNA2_172934_c1_seq1.p1  ORF type:complete len:106 (+),score=2.88 gnl/TRDRNA2_/TRDRNA2_172934_c1_seq1:877-1194(+)
MLGFDKEQHVVSLHEPGGSQQHATIYQTGVGTARHTLNVLAANGCFVNGCFVRAGLINSPLTVRCICSGPSRMAPLLQERKRPIEPCPRLAECQRCQLPLCGSSC